MTWKHPNEYDLCHDVVQVLCKVTQPQTSDFPRACELPVSSGDHGVGELFVSIGWCSDNDDIWYVAGWNMSQDCWQDANCFDVVGWQSLAETPVVTPTELRQFTAPAPGGQA